jgi:uncharacterized protein YidB (DUF937 family)
MGLLDNIFGSQSGPAVPGGNVTKPLMVALLALLAARYMSGSQKAPQPDKTPSQADTGTDLSSGAVIGGLGGLLKQFQDAGLGDLINSWVNTGPNKTAAPGDIAGALGPDVIDSLSKRTGLPKDEVVAILSQVLPKAVDQLTPQGRLPTRQELEQG